MPILMQFRRSAALWVTPVVVLLAVLNIEPAVARMAPYWLAASAQASANIIILGPVAAACGAWEAGRYRRAVTDGVAPVRGLGVVAAWNLASVAVMAVAVLAVSFAVTARRTMGVPGGPDLRFLGLAFMLAMSFALAGYALGTVLAPVYAVPTALIGVLLWLIYPRAFEPFWIRHLTGNFYESCCGLDSVIDARALAAPALLAAGVAAAGLLVIRRPRLGAGIAALTVLAAASTGAWQLVRGLGPDPTQPRRTGLVCTSEANLQICAWPENADRLAEAREHLSPAVRRLAAAGLATPRRLTEGPVTDRDTWAMVIAPGARPADIVWSMVSGRIPPMPACAKTQPWQNSLTEGAVAGWLARTAGLARDEVETRIGTDPMTATDRILARPRDEQTRWVKRNVHTLLTRCDADAAGGP